MTPLVIMANVSSLSTSRIFNKISMLCSTLHNRLTKFSLRFFSRYSLRSSKIGRTGGMVVASQQTPIRFYWSCQQRWVVDGVSEVCNVTLIFFTAFWRWQHKYVQPKRAGIAPFLHVVFISMGVFYVLNYGKLCKYSCEFESLYFSYLIRFLFCSSPQELQISLITELMSELVIYCQIYKLMYVIQ